MWYLLTGSLPSMASSQSFLLASEKACNVMIPCLWTINILHKSICKTHTYIWTVMCFPCASDSREIRKAAFRRPQKADLGVRFPNCDVIWSQKTCIFFFWNRYLYWFCRFFFKPCYFLPAFCIQSFWKYHVIKYLWEWNKQEYYSIKE